MVLARALPRVAIQQTRAFAAVRAKHTLPPLPYAYDVSHRDPAALFTETDHCASLWT